MSWPVTDGWSIRVGNGETGRGRSGLTPGVLTGAAWGPLTRGSKSSGPGRDQHKGSRPLKLSVRGTEATQALPPPQGLPSPPLTFVQENVASDLTEMPLTCRSRAQSLPSGMQQPGPVPGLPEPPSHISKWGADSGGLSEGHKVLTTGTPCSIVVHFIVLLRCCIFYKMKARPPPPHPTPTHTPQQK